MKNKELIEMKLKTLERGLILGCYNQKIEELSKTELVKVLDNLSEEWTDVDVTIGKKEYIVEIATVDNERDFDILTKAEYISRYGDERWDKDDN